MGVAGSTQRLRPLVNPDGSIGIKVRPKPAWEHPDDRLIRTLPPMDPNSVAHLRPPGSFPPQINKRLIQKLDGIEDDTAGAPSVRYDPFKDPLRFLPVASRRTSITSSRLRPFILRSGSSSSLVPRGPQRALPNPASSLDAALIAEASQSHPGLDNALAKSTHIGQLLLKNEADELDRVREYASQLHADSYAMRARETPCAAEREACRLCYETNRSDTLRCGNEVAAYDACAREAQRRFVEGVGVGGADE